MRWSVPCRAPSQARIMWFDGPRTRAEDTYPPDVSGIDQISGMNSRSYGLRAREGSGPFHGNHVRVCRWLWMD